MIRRFEIYSIAAGADPGGVGALETACRDCARFIPEVQCSHVGWNVSDAPAHLIWEHAFASPEAYQRYMVHPYHACVLDRYILHDSPERVVADNDLAAGLVGYEIDGPAFEMAAGVRRVVLLRVDRHASDADVHRLTAALGEGPASVQEMALSVVGANTLGSRWFDGVTPVAGRPRWTHLWEQGFDDVDDLTAYLAGTSTLAEAERRGWRDSMNGIVTRSASFHYLIDGPRPWPRPPQGVQE